MDSKVSPILEPSAEVYVDMSSESTKIDKNSQDGRKSTSVEDNQRITDQLETKEVPVEGSSEGMAIDQASQDGCTPTLFQVSLRITNQSKSKEIHVDVSSKDIGTNKAPQDGLEPIEGMPTPVVNKGYRKLFVAAQKGDWKTVEKKLKKDCKAMTAEIMKIDDEPVTVLDVAIMASQDELVKNLIKRILIKHEEFDFRFSLGMAALRGRIKMVKALVNEVKDEPESVAYALWIVTSFAPKQKKVIWYLAKHTKSDPVGDTMSNLIMAGHSDVALYLARRYKNSECHAETNSILSYLAKMESNFCSGARLNFWEDFFDKSIPLCLIDTSHDETPAPALKWFKISLWNLATKPGAALLINRTVLRHKCSLELAKLVLTKMESQMETPKIHELLSPIVLEAASRGISEIVKLCFEHFPELTWNENFAKRIVQEVVKGRHVELFRLLNAPNTFPFLADDTTGKENLRKAIVEWSPRCLPRDVSGAPFIMQRELQWFKVLEDTSDPSSKSMKFKKPLIEPAQKSRRSPEDKQSYWDDFVEKRKQLLQEAREWMKNTSASCSLVSTLIITVAFAAVFTLPGGNNNNGIPSPLKTSPVKLFAVANALALSSAVTATLMFLAILTSRYSADDFLMSLPEKMILGLTFLFLSLAFMLVAFGSALTIVLSGLMSEGLRLIYIPITVFATILAVLFAILQLPLFLEMLKSTYWPRLYRPLELWK